MIQLKEFSNWERFVSSEFTCPDCSDPLLEDRWPPNYGGGSGGIGPDGGFSTWGANVKCVCVKCRTQRVVSTYRKTNYSNPAENEQATTYHDAEPLEERDGVWLTKHDVWREDYKNEHGDYPVEAYG